MKIHNAIFAGTARNVEKYIEKNLDYIDKCGAKFKNYIVIIYENDSEDDTRNILIKNFKSNYYYIFEDNIKEQNRTIRIANGRNLILNKIRQLNNMSNNFYDYLIMLDLDDIHKSGNFINSIEECFKIDVQIWDGLMANKNGIYYDVWALRCKNVIEYDCWKVYAEGDDKIKEEVMKLLHNINFPINNNLIEVDSAFGGIAIYKIKSIPNDCYYCGYYIENNNMYARCEHVYFNENIKKNGGKLFILPSFLID